MLSTLKITLILFTIFLAGSGDEIYKKAEKIEAEINAKNENLHRTYNSSSTDYMHIFQVEIFGPSLENKKANILLQYQRLVKQYGRCKRKTFQRCLLELGKRITKNDKCQLQNGLCNCNEKYSRVSGFCNNLHFPNMGRANTPYNRILKQAYSDGISKFRRTDSDEDLPNARILGNFLSNAHKFKKDTHKCCGNHINNFCGIMFSQLITHDTTSRKLATIKGNSSDGISCCKSDNSLPLQPSERNPSCIPVQLPKNDPFYASKDIFCQSFVRMTPTLENNCTIDYAPENIVTSFLDLNIIYSNSDEELRPLRANYSGLFNMTSDNLLPEVDGEIFAPDFRFLQTPLLAIQHSLFYRLHNFIAKLLAALNPCWNDDELFFESRRITIACYQHIIYNEWLPLVLGKDRMYSYKLNTEKYCDKYNPHINPTTLIEYANNAFRWFHTNIPTNISLVDENGVQIEEIRLSDTYFNLDLFRTKYNRLLSGILKQKQRMHQASYTGEIRNLFVKTLYKGEKAGADTMLLDIMRSRDSGTPSYIEYYPMCLSRKIKCWNDLKPYFEREHFHLLKKLYKHVKDVDLMVGILLEKRCGNEMGKIGGCLVAEQFYRFKYGDRFFYSHCNKFSEDQLLAIKKMTFSRLVCMTTDLKIVPENGFISISKENPYIECIKIKPIDLSSFKDRCCHSSSKASSCSSSTLSSSSSTCKS